MREPGFYWHTYPNPSQKPDVIQFKDGRWLFPGIGETFSEASIHGAIGPRLTPPDATEEERFRIAALNVQQALQDSPSGE